MIWKIFSYVGLFETKSMEQNSAYWKPVGLQFDFQNIHRSFRKHNFFTLSHIRCHNVVYIFSVLSSTNHYFNINSRIIDIALCNCIIEQFQK